MTGEKDRYTTTEKLWKLDDATLTTPKHDEMVLDLLDPEYVKVLLPWVAQEFGTPWVADAKRGVRTRAYSGGAYSPDAETTQLMERLDNADESGRAFVMGQWVLDRVKEGTRSRMVPLGGGRIGAQMETWTVPRDPAEIAKAQKDIGELYQLWQRAADLAVAAETPPPEMKVDIKSEVPISQSNGFILGYFDVVVSIDIGERWRGGSEMTSSGTFAVGHSVWFTGPANPGVTYIEVKPAVQSFGQTLRQLNTYRDALKRRTPDHREPRMCLYTAETRFDAAFESQGIIALHPIPRP